MAKETKDNTAADPEVPVKAKPKRIVIEFEHVSFQATDFSRITRSHYANPNSPSGVGFRMKIQLFSHPYEEIFNYPTEEALEQAYTLLKMRLEENNIIFDLAKPMSSLMTQENDTDEETE